MQLSLSKGLAKGFTMVELLIVIIVLGILVAIVIPKFSNSGLQAKKAATLATLQIVRTQLGLAKVQHEEFFPALGSGESSWDMLLIKTEPTSDPSGHYPSGNGNENDVGPYLQRQPENPFEVSSTVASIGQASAGVGFVYEQSTGQIKAVVSSDIFNELELDSQDFEFY